MRISELSRRVGVTSETLRVWERRYGLPKPLRTAGNARRYSPLDEARVRLMQRYIAERMPPAQAAQLSLSRRLSLKPGTTDAVEERETARAAERMRVALDSFDESSADDALQQMIGQYSTPAVIESVILPYLKEAGKRRGTNPIKVAQEHFASNFLLFRLAAMSRGWDRGLGPSALLACAPEEQHTIGLICFGIALHHHGWRIAYLGARTPISSLADAAVQLRPDLVVVCATVHGHLEAHLRQIEALTTKWRLALAGTASSPALAANCSAGYLSGNPITAAAELTVTV